MSTPRKPEMVYYLASRCPSCGAAKSRPSATAFVYCDFCGSLADYDFKKACEQPKALPGPVYEKLVAKLKPQCEKALQASDREKYLDIQLKLFESWVDACPSAVPVRVSDTDFRPKYIVHLAECATACAFDAEAVKISEQMSDAMAKLKWSQSGGKTQCTMKSFIPLLQTVLATLDHCYSEQMQRQYAPYPDQTHPAVLKRMGHSMFVQGWLPYLDETAAKILLQKTGLAQEYLNITSDPSSKLSCGFCKNTIPVFQGAKQCVCEKCGHKLTVEQGLSCDGCGSHLAIDQNTKDFACPHCQRKIERVGSQWPSAFII